ncbi:lysophosphatidic acid receptor 6 [Polyodon spathula]|uniref:lysophosphatidic acid receptor 6 n=1 Tax=Polyodon spathula TaxID=7913 RepID=UPI001B7F4BD7|nr:lysophosphatidic acid receptor 6 [Polyodon spathula]XP_041094278.1 lysophosphatidic acid receptor 6 [Polyodon spathula]
MENSNSSEGTPNATCNDSEGPRWLFVAGYALISVTGLLLNLTALAIFYRHPKAACSHTTVYMTNLAVADLLLVLTLPTRIYQYSGARLSPGLCEAAGLVLLVNMYSSIFLLACMNLDRCLAVCFPLSSRVKAWRKRTPLVCLGVWTLTVGASLPTYLIKKTGGGGQQGGQCSCLDSLPVYATQPAAIGATLSVGFGIPLGSMLLCSWCLLRALRRSAAVQMGLVKGRKIRNMMAVNAVVFLLCFLPYHCLLVAIYLQVSGPRLLEWYQASLLIACSNTTLDPLVYYFTTQTFKDTMAVGKMRAFHSQSSDEQKRGASVPLNSWGGGQEGGRVPLNS